MAEPAKPTEDRHAAHATRLFGVETEYGFAVIQRNPSRLDRRESARALMREVAALVPHLHCGGPNDLFTANGSRVYIDCGWHPEIGTPECSTPEEAVRFTRAGDQLLARAARAVARKHPTRDAEVVLWKANVDHHTGATWGSHESYLHLAPQQQLAEQLMSHLVTRIVYTGAGGFDNLAHNLRFVVSPRAPHLGSPISGSSTCDRGIFHTRDEPLAGGDYRRLHVLAGESLWSHTADYLRIGTTALLVAQIDAGRTPQAGLELASPVSALQAIANDVQARTRLRLQSGERLSAIQIQRRLRDSVLADLGARHLPAWAPGVCEHWGIILEQLEATPDSLVGVLDWPTKLALLKRQCATLGIEWTFDADSKSDSTVSRKAARAAPLLEADMCFNRLDDGGIFAALDRQDALSHRITTPEAIEHAITEPPATGRARIRSECIKRFSGTSPAVFCSWQEVVDSERGQQLKLDDPFQSTGEHWSPFSSRSRRQTPSLEHSVQGIDDAFTNGRPRIALLRMRALLTGRASVSRTASRYCADVLQSLIPNIPVPVLPWGAASAGTALEALLRYARQRSDTALANRVGTMLYRFYEGRGDYHRAQRVIVEMLARATAAGDAREEARLTNNLGYEHLLARQWTLAIPLFERAERLFERFGRHDELPSVRANWLECQFGQRPEDEWPTLVPELTAVNRTLIANHDWRARKTLMLLARLAHARGRRAAAVRWAKRAVAATHATQTQLQTWDRAYLDALSVERPSPGAIRHPTG